MKQLLGVVIILLGITFGLYVGVYLCIVGGIIQIIEQIQAPAIQAVEVAWGVVKIFFGSTVGSLSATIPVGIGCAMATE